ncbi:glycosyltransferase [Patescibacteria group bacterium]|jgi:glycosyltransferase involved in cell wall biosynthesis|nr:glycosyltransferase [Patescibacteria group bacterium]
MPFSIVIPALNEENYLPVLLGSIADAGIEGLDVIVVDGKSDDRTQEIVRAFAEEHASRFSTRVFECEKRNVATQRNLGASHAAHETVVFLDADTQIPSRTAIMNLVEAFHAEECAAASCRFRPIKQHPLARLYYWALYRFHTFQERRRPYAMGAFIITKKTVFDLVGGFDETIRVNEDAHFVEQASKHGPFRIFSQHINVSTRRFDKDGYFKMGLRYVRLWADRTLRGELRDDRIEYKFGHYDS